MSTTMPTSPPSTPPAHDDTEILDAEWLAAPARRSRLRLGLIAVLTVLLVFLGGVLVQKHWGADSSGTTASGAPSGFPGGGTGSFPSGGFPSGGLPGGGSGQSAGSTGNDGTTGSGGSTSATPAVIGTLTAVHGHTWTVKDLGGHAHTVKVTDATTVTRPLGVSSDPIHAGAGITVQGTTHGRTVTATAVTLR
jgi:hypothetical protein